MTEVWGEISCGIPYPQAARFAVGYLQAFVDISRAGQQQAPPAMLRPSRTIFVVSTSYKTAEKVVERLYGDAATALDRKAVRAAKILSHAPDQPMVA